MPDQPKNYNVKTSLGERFIQAMLRMPRLISINPPNSPVVTENFVDFKDPLDQMCAAGGGQATLRIYHGRFYVNDKRVTFHSTQLKVINNMITFFQEREIQGLRFYANNDLTPDDVSKLTSILAHSAQANDTLAWIRAQIAAKGMNWVQLLTDQDFKQNEDLDEEEETNDCRAYSPAMCYIGRRTYAQAIAAFRHVAEKLTAQERVGMQKPKRVMLNLLELLEEDESILLGLSTIRDCDNYTSTHAVNVALMSMCLGKRLGLSATAIGQLGLCGLFHDIGTIDVPEDLMHKPAQLTNEEFELIKTHSLSSVRQIIKMTADYSLKAKLLLPPFEHHLGINLNGYPQSERKTPLSLFSRVIAICDHYDAMTTDRSYRQVPIRPDQAMRMMIDEAGDHLDPVLLKMFIAMMGVYPIGTLLLLDTNEVGLALETPEWGESRRPLVRLLRRNPNDGELTKGDSVDLAELDQTTGQFSRNVVRCMHPADYGIQPVDYLF